MPRLGPGPEIGMPHIRLSPLVACSKPAAIRSSVDLPQPEAPIRQMNSPLRTRRFAQRFDSAATLRVDLAGVLHFENGRCALSHATGSMPAGGGRSTSRADRRG